MVADAPAAGPLPEDLDGYGIAVGASAFVAVVTNEPPQLGRVEVIVGSRGAMPEEHTVELACPSGRLVVSDVAFDEPRTMALPRLGRYRLCVTRSVVDDVATLSVAIDACRSR